MLFFLSYIPVDFIVLDGKFLKRLTILKKKQDFKGLGLYFCGLEAMFRTKKNDDYIFTDLNPRKALNPVVTESKME